MHWRRIRDRGGALVLVAAGGFCGSAARYGVGLAVPPGVLPWGTLAANTLGCFALGALLYGRQFADALSAETRLLVGTGFLSSFTTYSTFAVETSALAPVLAGGYVAVTYGLGLFGVVCGRWVARWAS